MASHFPPSHSVNTGPPQGCVLSPLLCTLLTSDCSARYPSSHIVQFADDAAVVGLISDNESVYRWEVDGLCINVGKTEEIERPPPPHPPTLEEQLWRWSPPVNTWA